MLANIYPPPDEQGLKKEWGPSLALVGGLLVYLLVGLILWWILDQYIRPHGSGAKRDLVQALGLIMAGLAGAIGIYITWRTLTITQKNMKDTLKKTETQLRLAEEGQVTERFTKAIDQLGEIDDTGNLRVEIRIGGIYALDRIARHYQQQSPKDYGPVVELLAAYIRENAKWITKVAPGPTLKAHQLREFLHRFSASGARADIQAALEVLGRRNEERMLEQYRVPIDLRRTNLSGARLIGANLSGTDFTQANLSGAFLFQANLSDVDLSDADLSGALLSGADLSKALLLGTRLEGALLAGVTLSGHALAQVSRHLGKSRQEVGNKMLIKGTDLTTAEELSQGQIEWAIGDNTTKAPQYLDQPKVWSDTVVPIGNPPAESPPPEPSPTAPNGEWKEWQERKSEWQEHNADWERRNDEHDDKIIEQIERIATHLTQEYERDDRVASSFIRRLAALVSG